MEFQIDINNVNLIQHDQVESGEYNVTECTFNFSNEYEGLTKKAIFTGEDGTAYLQTIVDNKCSIPSEILATSQVVQIGVYAYAVENEELILRYSPEPTDFFIHEGSYKEAQNSTPPTPSEVEQLQAQITSNKNDIEEIQGDVVDINQDIVDIKAEQITQNENIQTNANNISTINEQISDINETITNLETNKANVTDLNALTERVSTNERDIDTIDGHISDINQNIDDLEQDLTNYSLITETGSQINLNINSSNFQMTAILKDKNGNVIHTSNVIDLPLETMVVGASYDNVTKEVVLILQNGTTLRFSVADLVSGLVSETQLQTILANYYTKTEVDNLLSALAERVSTNETDIADIKEEQTTQNTNIEELQNQVETLQEDLDNANSEIEELNTDITNMRKAMITVDGQGSDITLQNTSENKFVEFGLEGRTEQDGEPTPETPIPIKNVTGNANVKIQNKNLFDGTLELGIYSGSTGQKVSNNEYVRSTNYIEVNELTNYKFSNDGVGISLDIYEYKEDYSYNLTGTKLVNSTSHLTTEAGTKYITFRTYNKTTDTNMKIQLEQGSTATSYVEHQEQNLPFSLKSKNLFDKDNANVLNNIFISGDRVLKQGVNNATVYISCKPNTTYTIQKVADNVFRAGTTQVTPEVNVTVDDFNNNPTGNVITLTTSNNAKYLVVFIRNAETSKSLQTILNSLQIEEGSTATDYEPYYEYELSEIDTAQDYFYKENGKWHLHKEIRKRIISSVSGVGTASSGIKYANIGSVPNVLGGSYIYCENYINSSDASKNNSIRVAGVYLFVYDNRFTNVETAQSLLNGLEYYHIMETPTNTEITDTTLIEQLEAILQARSYDDITYITSTSDELGFNMKTIAVADANKLIDSLDTRLLALEGNTNQSKSLNVAADTKNITKETAEDTAENTEQSVESEEQ